MLLSDQNDCQMHNDGFQDNANGGDVTIWSLILSLFLLPYTISIFIYAFFTSLSISIVVNERRKRSSVLPLGGNDNNCHSWRRRRHVSSSWSASARRVHSVIKTDDFQIHSW